MTSSTFFDGSSLGRVRGLRASHLAVAVALIGLSSFVAACGGDTASEVDAPPPASARDGGSSITVGADQPVVIGVSTALTGPVGERGTEYRDAVAVGVLRWQAQNGETILDHPIEIHSEDDGCTEADQTAVAAQRLIATAGLVGVLGPQCSAGAAAVISAYADAGVVTISGSATATALTTDRPAGGYFFRAAFRNDLQGNIVGSFVAETLKAKTTVLVDNGETYGQDLAASTERFLVQNGVSVQRETAPQGTVDFSELVTAIARADPGAVGYAGFNPDAALFYRQLRDAGYTGAFGGFDAAASNSEFVAPLGEVANGAYFAGCAIELPDDFRADFEDLHGGPPAAAFNGQYADATRALLDAVERTARRGDDGSLSLDRNELRDAVRATAITDGLTGAITFDSHGDRSSARTEPSDQASDFGLVGCQVEGSELVQIQGQ